MRVLLNRKTFSAEFVTIFRFLVFKMCDFLFLFPEYVIFASKMKKETLPNNTTLYEVEQNGFMAGRNSRFEFLPLFQTCDRNYSAGVQENEFIMAVGYWHLEL